MLCAKVKKVFFTGMDRWQLKNSSTPKWPKCNFWKIIFAFEKKFARLEIRDRCKNQNPWQGHFLGCRTICRKASLSKSQNGDVLKGQIVEMVTCWRGNLSKYSYLCKRLFVKIVIWQNGDLFNGKFLKWDILSKW